MAWMDPLTTNLLDLLFELREHPLFRPEFPVTDFRAVLSEIFHA
jgi:hypothetical protein